MSFRNLSCLMLFLCTSAILADRYEGKAAPEAIVVEGKARFQVLTPHIIRMEWSADGEFEDHASLTVVQRRLLVPGFQTIREDGELIIRNDAFELRYTPDGERFSAENLEVSFNHGTLRKTWVPGTAYEGNLLGTTRTLDGVSGSTVLEQGLLSRDGWTLIDDSERPLFDDSDWQWVKARPEGDRQDWYLLMYGNQYKMILGEFVQIAGRIPLPPKFAFGYWWSRYKKYNDHTFRSLIEDIETHDIPLDVLVIDMDWHITDRPEWFTDGKRLKDQTGQPYGWTGYTWNRAIFPDPGGFLDYTAQRNLQTCLNLHPASGIQPHEEVYPEFAKAMGQDPGEGKYVPFNITDKEFAEAYFDLVIHPMERDGVDFWWLDWQQWSVTNIRGVNPTFYLNYVHFSDMERQGAKRPLLYHRWGGLGNHRYQIGFSGDTHIGWDSLAFQPYFTTTAANVCYGYWSHDIGGHTHGDKKNAELYTRWIQWGAFSPILRTHSTRDKEIERRIWAYAPEYFEVMHDTIKLRYALIPYIYTSARESYDTGISLLRPMYYDYPVQDIAYEVGHQYMFGDDMIVAPVAHPMNGEETEFPALSTNQEVWLPEGEWIEWATGSILQGNRVYKRPACLEDIPVYVKAGAIIPMQEEVRNTAEASGELLILNIFPGPGGSTEVYDDNGNNDNYKEGAFTRTLVSFETEGKDRIVVRISPVEGAFDGMPLERRYELRFPLSFPPESVEINGVESNRGNGAAEGHWIYDGDTLTTLVYSISYSVHEPVTVSVRFMKGDREILSGKRKQLENLNKLAAVLNAENWRTLLSRGWQTGPADLDEINRLATTGIRISMNPESLEDEVASLEKGIAWVVSTLEARMDNSPEWRPYLDLIRLEY